MMIAVRSDTCAIVHEGWSPQELLELEPRLSVITPSVLELMARPAVCERVRPSLVDAGFERLHCLFDPRRRDFSVAANRVAVLGNAKMSVTSMGLVIGSGTSLTTRVSKFLDPLNLFSGPVSDARNEAVLDACSMEELFHVCTDFAQNARYTVERSQTMVWELIRALKVAFPHLLLPFVGSPDEVSEAVLTLLLKCCRRHSEELCGFMPLNVFLLERRQLNVVTYFAKCADALRLRDDGVDSLAVVTNPQSRSERRSFISSVKSMFRTKAHTSGQPRKLSLDEGMALAREHAALLPLATEHHLQQSGDMSRAVTDLAAAARETVLAVQREAESLEELAGVLEEHLPILSSTPPLVDVEWEEDAETPRLCNITTKFVSTAADQQTNVTLSVSAMVPDAADTLSMLAASAFHHIVSMIEAARLVSRTEETLARSPATLSVAHKETFAAARNGLRTAKGDFPQQLGKHRATWKEHALLLCVYVTSMSHHLTDPFDAYHFHEGDQTTGKSKLHPILAAFAGVPLEPATSGLLLPSPAPKAASLEHSEPVMEETVETSSVDRPASSIAESETGLHLPVSAEKPNVSTNS